MSEGSFPEIAPLPAVMGMKDVCDLIGITSETARRLINDGALPGHRVPGGRQWVFRTEEVLTAISGWDGGAESEAAAQTASTVVQSTEAGLPPEAGPTPDPTGITCPAPGRTQHGDEAWLQECTHAWINVAACSGVVARMARPGVVTIGDSEMAITVDRCRLRVVDDYGDERDDELALVSARPVAE